MYAFYEFGFYELDQSIAIGQKNQFVFFLNPSFGQVTDWAFLVDLTSATQNH